MADITFCYWDAKSKLDLVVIIVNQTIVTTIAIVAILRLPNLLSLSHSKLNIQITRILLIHSLIILWAICQSIVNYYSILVFIFDLPPEVTSMQMIGYSHTFAIICSFPGFLVQTLFITICYTFCHNLIRKTEIKHFPNYSMKFVYILKVYFIFRIIVRAIVIILMFIASDDKIGIYSTAGFITLIIDSAIINIFIICSIRIFINRLKHTYFRPLKNQYLIMLSCSICRIIIDSLYLIVSQYNEVNNLCVSESTHPIIYTILYNITGNVLIHFIPIAIILKIYRFDQKEAAQKESDSCESQNNY